MENKKIRKLSDVSYKEGYVANRGRMDRYWKAHTSKIIKGVRQKRVNKNVMDKYALSPYSIMIEFKLKGFEFGNWLSTPEKYDHFYSCVLALEDLRDVLKIKNIGFDHHIGVAFGARGHGGKNRVAAHFEPSTNMINLTKLYGASSLAHEYAHALDYFLGTYVDLNPSERSLSGARLVGMEDYPGRKGELRELMRNLIVNISTTKSYQAWCHYAKKQKKYWCNHTEMFARVFEQYIAHVLYAKKCENTYLTQSVDYYEKHPYYLIKSDRVSVFRSLNRLLKKMQASFYES